MLETELAWYGGFFDARGVTTETYIRINAINLNDRLVLDLFKEKFGGHIGVSSIRKRQQLHWLLTGKGMRDFLEAIQPYRILARAEMCRVQSILDNQNS